MLIVPMLCPSLLLSWHYVSRSSPFAINLSKSVTCLLMWTVGRHQHVYLTYLMCMCKYKAWQLIVHCTNLPFFTTHMGHPHNKFAAFCGIFICMCLCMYAHYTFVHRGQAKQIRVYALSPVCGPWAGLAYLTWVTRLPQRHTYLTLVASV